jgi:hypothetical protein
MAYANHKEDGKEIYNTYRDVTYWEVFNNKIIKRQ